MDNEKQYFYPLTIVSNRTLLSFNKKIIIRKITESELKTFFGIENRILNAGYSLTSCNTVGSGYYPLGDIANHVLANTIEIFSSNYVLVSKTGTLDAQRLNEAIKLMFPGRSGVYLGFNNESPAIQFIHPNPYFKGRKLFTLGKNNERELVDLFFQVEKFSKDELFNLLMELYLNALSGLNQRDETRFIDLFTLLEILYLKDGKDGEMKFRFSLRLAKVLSKHYKENTRDIYTSFNSKKGLYQIRSDIVQSGKSKLLTTDALESLVEYTRKSLLLYLKDPNIYRPENLNILVLS